MAPSATPPPRRAAARPAGPDVGRARRKKKARRAPGGRLWRWRRWWFAIALIGFALVASGLYYVSRQPLPSAAPLEQTTFVYDAQGHLLTTFSEQNRVTVSLNQVPQVVIDAVVSTEDRHFFTEGAIDPVGIVRAFFSDIRNAGSLQGASTITQQYVKQAYLTPQRTLTRKLKEAELAIRLAETESKQEILQNYLNTIYWGRGAYGVQAASQAYFGMDVSQLTLPEASLLAGLIRDPDGADPAVNPTLARTNQGDTLKALVRDHHITATQATSVEALPYAKYVIPRTTSSTSEPDTNGEAYFLEAVQQELVAKYGREMVDSGGLRVTTTLDPKLQAEAYNAVYGTSPDALNPAAGGPSGALVSMDDNGAVKALVGGQEGQGHVDLALGKAGGGSGRQAGSTFKAFMLAEVIKDGYTPYSVFPAPPEVELPGGNADGTPWTVTNFEDETVPPEMSLVDATALSVNTVYAQVVDRIGAANLDTMAEALGINPSELAGAYLSQVLGTADVSPLEMAAAYATFADGGVYHAPMLITKVTTADRTPLPLPVEPQSRVVLTAAQAAEETYVLQQVVLRGTGTAAGDVGSEIAGKTGTTEHSTDAWFIGYTPNLTTAVWMGYANSAQPMNGVQGGGIPAQLWHNYMVAALASEPQYQGSFPIVYYLAGATLTPPASGSVLFPLGLGTTTTTAPPTTTTTTPSSTTTPTSVATPTTAATPTPTTPVAHPTTTLPPVTAPPHTTPPTSAAARPAATASSP